MFIVLLLKLALLILPKCVFVQVYCKLQHHDIFREFGRKSTMIKLEQLKNAGKNRL